MMARERKRERAIALATALVLAGALAGGCSAPARAGAGRTTEPAPVRDAGRLVLPTDRVLASERAAGPASRYEWFAYGRNNDQVSARHEVPILARNQWPVPPRPLERRIRFWYWEQR